MGRDENDKSLLGKLARFHEKIEDGVDRRMDHNNQQAQARLNKGVNDMSLQEPSEVASQRSRHSGSSFIQTGERSIPQSGKQPEQPPQYSQEHTGPSQQAVLGPQKLHGASLGKPPIPTVPITVDSSSSAASQYFSTNFASLSLHMSDRIRLMDFPPVIVELVRLVLKGVWQRGIQAENPYYGSYEFKLYGTPWRLMHDTQSIDARRLVRHLFEALYDNGWVLALSTDISRKQTDKDTLIFRHQVPSPTKSEWITIDFYRGDRIRVLDAPQDMLDAIQAQLKPAIQNRVQTTARGLWEIKLLGYPWRASGGETMDARRILLQLFSVLERFGFTVYASVDQESTTRDNTSETDTWHCLRPVGWTPGAPVYHG